MIDCSHANSSKQHERQLDVARDVAAQIRGGSRRVFGVMVGSNIHGGAQQFTPGKDAVAPLDYGPSITDACIGWDGTQTILQTLADAVRGRP
jgi:3-deoxy-7-phosphoheptulonate synthase